MAQKRNSRKIALLYLLAVLTAISGCSQFYHGFQILGAENCYKLSYPDQQACLDQVQVEYEEYEQQRNMSKVE